MNKISVSIVGGSGYAGGDLIRLLLFHPNVELKQVTSERFLGKALYKVHPNLRKQTDLKFCAIDELESCDVIFLCLPHGKAMGSIEKFNLLADKIIDLSADFRLNNPAEFKKWYGEDHKFPEKLNEFVYGIPELHREEMKTAKYISSAGCNATTTILGLYPLYKEGLVEPDRTVVEVKVGSSEGGNRSTESSHHPVKDGSVRSYQPTQHRHTAEIIQELSFGKEIKIHFSATALDIVRGILATSHVFLNQELEEKDIWKLYRKYYANEYFIRIVKEKEGNYRYPEPKIVAGTNFCDIGFKKDEESNRLVVISSIDNLMKGAAGQALQAFNIMNGLEEKTGLEFPGLHPY
ncbi:MAG: N-acetyl-gamma-glutamyl-phosphate reductase [Melioribacteraceae bacterium]|nr:N-acetyl-gamma-glutamyl-phosphate reductase [Melioribacteraceae bacterium]MCF8413040.1 N-acetyl-gamma-glutamyl-phosphate reductase [Melioribacteraceae bacterium]